ncbi:MAG TPA: TetR/AcrR family transcriptional regulator [Polyangiales bacterium]|nr:TetR/AcrR family transcriptional regulator [Polyangiales bacterium]
MPSKEKPGAAARTASHRAKANAKTKVMAERRTVKVDRRAGRSAGTAVGAALAPRRGVHAATAAAGVAPSSRPTLMDESPRGRLLRAAAHLFLTRGYAQTTVRDLARAVGILSGSIFHHFESKEEILEAVMTEVSLLNAERMRVAVKLDRAPLDRVRALVRCELEAIHADTSEAMTLLVSEWRSLSSAAQTRVLLARERYEEVWLDALREAQGELAAIDSFVLRRLLQGMTSSTANWYRPRGPLTLDALTDQILSLLTRKRARVA